MGSLLRQHIQDHQLPRLSEGTECLGTAGTGVAILTEPAASIALRRSPGGPPMTMARAHLVDVSVTPWYHCITRCLCRA
jgi:hypothetical protein